MNEPNKQALREVLRNRRAALEPELRRIMDTRVREGVLKAAEWARAQVVLPYLSRGDEVGTRLLIKAALAESKVVALPRVVVGAEVPTLAWYRVLSMDELVQPGALEKSALGIEEPVACAARLLDVPAECAARGGEAVLALVPGLAFDAQGQRIGYGGGYYDAFLRTFPGVSLGLCRRAFYVSELPFLAPHDVPVTRVIVG